MFKNQFFNVYYTPPLPLLISPVAYIPLCCLYPPICLSTPVAYPQVA